MVILMASCFGWLKNRNKPNKDIKLVIIGLDDAGKTTTVACLQGVDCFWNESSPFAQEKDAFGGREPPDGITPTVGFSNATLNFGKWNVTLYDLGGGVNVRTVWKKYFAEIYGIIFTIDSGNEERVDEAKDVLYDIFQDPKVSGKPVVVFANKQDKQGALGEAAIKEKLRLQNLSDKHRFKYNVFPCSATKGFGKQTDKSIKQGITWLLNTINEDFSTIHEKVEKESLIQKQEETKERKERLERIRKLKEEREKAAKEAGIEEDDNEEDDDVMGGPFRNINDQIKVTEKREKKEKENLKKIKAHQAMTTQQMEVEENETDTRQKPKKKKGKKKKIVEDDDIGHDECDSPEKDTGVKFPKIDGSRDSGLSDTFEDNDTFRRKSKKKKKKKKIVDDENEADDYDDNNAHAQNTSHHRGRRKHPEEEHMDYDDEEDTLKQKKKKKNKQLENINASRTNFIVVSSSENVKEDDDNISPRRKSKKRTAKARFVDDNNDDDKNIEEVKNTRTSQEKINDSRSELFRARSSDALKTTESESKVNSKSGKKKKGKKKKKKQREEEEEVENVEEVLSGSNEDLEKKRRKKKNRTEPNGSCYHDDEPSLNETPFTANGTAKWNGKLPPIRENGHTSKLQPIELRGRLPDIGKSPSHNGSLW